MFTQPWFLHLSEANEKLKLAASQRQKLLPVDKIVDVRPELRSKESFQKKLTYENYAKMPANVTFGKDGSLVPADSGPSALMTPEMEVASVKYYEDTTVDYIRRLIEESLDPYVFGNKARLLAVVDQLGATSVDQLVMTDQEIEQTCLDLFNGFPGQRKCIKDNILGGSLNYAISFIRTCEIRHRLPILPQ